MNKPQHQSVFFLLFRSHNMDLLALLGLKMGNEMKFWEMRCPYPFI